MKDGWHIKIAKGMCEDRKGNLQTTGKKMINTRKTGKDCVYDCQRVDDKATGCEYDAKSEECWVHTHQVADGDAILHTNIVCYIFVKKGMYF